MQVSSLLGHTQELLSLIRKSPRPADSVIDSFFRSRKYLGSHDRRYIAETTYGTLRHLRKCEALVKGALNGNGSQIPPEDGILLIILAYCSRIENASPRDLVTVKPRFRSEQLKNDLEGFLERLRTVSFTPSSPPERLATEYSFPDWLTARFVAQYGEEESARLMECLNQQAPLNLRVNALRTTVDDCREQLKKEGVETSRTDRSPVGLSVAKRLNIFRIPSFKDGFFEVQDEGSQLLGILLDPKPTWKVLDACAGAGGKTLHLAAIMGNRGEIVAADVNNFRLMELRKRARRAGAFNVRVKSTDELQADEGLREFFDLAFLDSPCSGMGTLRRNPGLKWTIAESDLEELRAKQLHILETHSAFVKPGGLLFYATCSLLREENEDIVDEFLKRHSEFVTVDLSDYAAKVGLGDCVKGGVFKLVPHIHGTDGFFCGAMQRTPTRARA